MFKQPWRTAHIHHLLLASLDCTVCDCGCVLRQMYVHTILYVCEYLSLTVCCVSHHCTYAHIPHEEKKNSSWLHNRVNEDDKNHRTTRIILAKCQCHISNQQQREKTPSASIHQQDFNKWPANVPTRQIIANCTNWWWRSWASSCVSKSEFFKKRKHQWSAQQKIALRTPLWTAHLKH